MTRRPLLSAGLALGMGMGGFFDGILFHQILQFHNMLSARIPNTDYVGAKVNMVWDGVFHAGVWAITALGIALLWRAGRRPGANLSGRLLVGALLIGWGLFNLVEGVIDHHLLHLHHVYEPMGLSAWDWLFLLWGAGMLGGGWWLCRRS
ncbi:DUF2243 domain-containing protein [Sphingomonas sp. 3-13AW]|jgi:uncharacterized membrane protein|uniref:DUF2243 domain-containing protein n=1 Tax=Sphingomonas sp. 3-13AW TaxID=3050450 RepID=UPI003BB54765